MTIFLPILIILAILSFGGSILLSQRLSIFLDRPNARSSHTAVIPRCGGIVVALILLVTLSFLASPFNYAGFFLGAILIFLVGLYDDWMSLSGKVKILGMAGSSLLPVFFGSGLKYLDIISHQPLLLILLSIVWIYGMINAFNFMDGIDGLVVGCSIIFSYFILQFSWNGNEPLVFYGAMIIMAIGLSFLLFNYNPASIFLGDSGSMLLGYVFALFSIMISNNCPKSIPIYAFLFLYAPIIYDSMFTFIKRGLQGKNVIEAHREHLYQRLVILGFSHRNVSLVYYLLSLAFGVLASLFIRFPGYRPGLIFIGLSVLLGFTLAVSYLEKAALRKN